MLTVQFWRETLERALKTAAQVAATAMGADGLDLLNLEPRQIAASVVTVAIASVLTSIATAGVGAPGSPSAVELQK